MFCIGHSRTLRMTLSTRQLQRKCKYYTDMFSWWFCTNFMQQNYGCHMSVKPQIALNLCGLLTQVWRYILVFAIFCCTELIVVILAYLSQRLIGELIVYPWSGVRSSWSTISNTFFSETTWAIKAKSYVEPPWVGGTKVCMQHLGHMTKMATKNLLLRNRLDWFPKLGM